MCYVCLRWSASHHCCLQESCSAQWCHCNRGITMIRVQRWQTADLCRHKWGCAHVSQPLVIAASRNHPLPDSVHVNFSSSASDSSWSCRCRLYSWALETKPRCKLHNHLPMNWGSRDSSWFPSWICSYILQHTWMHTAKPHGKRGIALYFAYVTVACIYISQPLSAGSRNHTLLNSVATLVLHLQR